MFALMKQIMKFLGVCLWKKGFDSYAPLLGMIITNLWQINHLKNLDFLSPRHRLARSLAQPVSLWLGSKTPKFFREKLAKTYFALTEKRMTLFHHIPSKQIELYAIKHIHRHGINVHMVILCSIIASVNAKKIKKKKKNQFLLSISPFPFIGFFFSNLLDWSMY